MLKVILFSFLVSCAALAQAELFVADAEPALPLLGEQFDNEVPDDSNEFDSSCVSAIVAVASAVMSSASTKNTATKLLLRISGAQAIRAPPLHSA